MSAAQRWGVQTPAAPLPSTACGPPSLLPSFSAPQEPDARHRHRQISNFRAKARQKPPSYRNILSRPYLQIQAYDASKRGSYIFVDSPAANTTLWHSFVVFAARLPKAGPAQRPAPASVCPSIRAQKTMACDVPVMQTLSQWRLRRARRCES